MLSEVRGQPPSWWDLEGRAQGVRDRKHSPVKLRHASPSGGPKANAWWEEVFAQTSVGAAVGVGGKRGRDCHWVTALEEADVTGMAGQLLGDQSEPG